MRESGDGARAIPRLKCGSEALVRACGSNRKNLGRDRPATFCFALRRVSSLLFEKMNNAAYVIEHWLFLFHYRISNNIFRIAVHLCNNVSYYVNYFAYRRNQINQIFQ